MTDPATKSAEQMRESAALEADKNAEDCGPSYGNGKAKIESWEIAARIRALPLPETGPPTRVTP